MSAAADGGITALVPMKGHSERIPNKNLREFRGRALCLWILDTLAAAPEVTEIVVNTDSAEIAAAVQGEHDVTVHERPEGIRGDFVSMNRVIEDDLARLPGRQTFLQTHCTNPLLTAETVSRAVAAFGERREDGAADSLFSVTRHQARFYDSGGDPVNHDPDELIRTQDLPPLYEENSCVYLFTRDSFGAARRRIGASPALFEIPRIEAVDIDEPVDFLLAEQLHRVRGKPGREES